MRQEKTIDRFHILAFYQTILSIESEKSLSCYNITK